jgi:eukaryotic-like serine/threonine-protein kinase
MLERRGVATSYTREQTLHWLGNLARQMKKHGQTVFYVERMQPDWLEDQWSRKRYPHLVYGLIFALIGTLCLVPSGAMMFNVVGYPVAALFFGLVCASFFGVLNGLLAGTPPVKKANGRNKWSWRRMLERLARILLNGCLVGLLIGLPFGIFILQQLHQIMLIITVIIFSFLGGLVTLLFDSILSIQTTEIRPMETFVWSWARMGRQFLKFVGLGLLASFLLWLLIALYIGLFLWTTTKTITGLTLLQMALNQALQFLVPLSFYIGVLVLLSGLLGAFTGGMSTNLIDERNLTKPNQGILRSALHSALTGMVSMLIGGVMGGVFAGAVLHEVDLIPIHGLIFGPLVGLITGLRNGGIACIQHVALRWLLRETDALPWNYARFLDYAAERVLLRKVGGGYIFIHRLLLEYFASL